MSHCSITDLPRHHISNESVVSVSMCFKFGRENFRIRKEEEKEEEKEDEEEEGENEEEKEE